jgi:hypothetical protein
MEVCAVSRRESSALVGHFLEAAFRVFPRERIRRFA